jgi:two-component system phosphate regulon response regulator PhoB
MSGLVLIVDDENDLVTTLEYTLQKEGYETRIALTGQEALDAIAESPKPDLILLDLMLPDISGTEICRRLRANEETATIPVLMLTAKGDEIDRVVGFEVGADDYVTKPFSVRELMLRVRAIIRRSNKDTKNSQVLEFGPLKLDKDAHRVWINDEEIILTALEFKLLAAFIARKGRVQSRDALLSDVWGIDAEVTTRTVDTHVKRLREKLGDLGSYIETLRGVGYRFRDQPDEA